MHSPLPSTLVRRSPHPLFAAAAISVIVLSATGVASMTGLIGRPAAQPAPIAVAPSVPETAAAAMPATVPQVAVVAPKPAAVAPRPQAPVADARIFATVESVREVRSGGDAQGIGAVAGGVLGGVLGHQVGGGNGRKVATVLGAVGGGLLGHQAERRVRGTVRHEATVRMDDGSVRTFTRDIAWPVQAGERVRVMDGTLVGAGAAPAVRDAVYRTPGA